MLHSVNSEPICPSWSQQQTGKVILCAGCLAVRDNLQGVQDEGYLANVNLQFVVIEVHRLQVLQLFVGHAKRLFV